MPSKKLAVIEVEASWSQAERLLSQVREGAAAYHQLGLMLLELREQTKAQGKGGGTSSHRETKLSILRDDSDLGFAVEAQKRLGVSKATAYRMMDAAGHWANLWRIAHGESVEYRDVANRQRTLRGTKENQAKARALIAEIETGGMQATKAWRGLIGFATTAGRELIAARYLLLDGGVLIGTLPRAVTSLSEGWKSWGNLEGAAREKFCDELAETIASGPPEVKTAIKGMLGLD